MISELIGWLGGAFLSICAMPEFLKSLRTKKCSFTWMFLILWGIGELLSLLYICFKSSEISLAPILVNCGLNLAFIATFLYYKGVIKKFRKWRIF